MAASVVNRKWVLKARPEGVFDPSRDVELVEETIDLTAVEDGMCVLEVEMLSCDAFLRTMMDTPVDGEPYHGSTPLGGTVPALGYGTVLKSCEGGPAVGTRMQGLVRAQTIAKCAPAELMPHTAIPGYEVPADGHLSFLSLTAGLTAHVGVFSTLGAPKKDDVCVVSAATGAVGSIAAQLAKSTGAKVIGIAGGPVKCKWLTETLKLDGVVDYKSDVSVGKQLDEVCPNGINFFFDNVGGDILQDVLWRIVPKARIVICGAISQYSGNLAEGKVQGPRNYLELAKKGACMAGFVVTQHMDTFGKAKEEMCRMQKEGILQDHQTRIKGIEEFPAALLGLFTGKAMGKTLVEV